MKTSAPAGDAGRTFTGELRFYWRHFHVVHFILVAVSPSLIVFGIQQVTLNWKTALWSVICYFIYSVAITAGYHRLWCHRSYRASPPLRYVLAALGAGQFQWSIIWWTRHHRAHHRYLDTDNDPYNARRGLFYSHVGWLIGYNPEMWGSVDISDVVNDQVAVWQRQYYPILAVVIGLLLPSAVAQIGWNDWQGGFVYAGLTRAYLYGQTTMLVNSLAHWRGGQSFSTTNSARDNLFVALLTSGEGYHNFHHRFPSDYRNGVHWYSFDPSKWLIWSCARLGLASGLTRSPDREIERAILDVQRQQSADSNAGALKRRPSSSVGHHPFPTMDLTEYERQTRTGRCLIIIAGYVCDVTDFIHRHPGGQWFLQEAIGGDASVAFDSVGHSEEAQEMVRSMQIASVHG
ncbi:putative fatty acid desaturase protein [Aspergillus flavus]|uniref:Acyl-CoA desaturase n=1 Tax=Aspergillus flavus (strain ATCC 200026 / FGSC A1120 / IAM 13836 / NRRL 3357 / JCM 12722 / SRRC 167) TaxID=332952 RepID=A0A7G5JZK8_ASPFN|nr:uncharacterized protein G4B84_004310 [Aspergillus flavus NRRL3357]KAF7617549.1 hypothetical protein AFLA_006469 [Aspergillus flavus NRRL3357]QMW28975.1 hypothetical protein G4B84_004310 [Aspergillus flavus NRRL3357]QMW41050.1 hypothetical protein G4B11_004374 [Aspergillus flavus]QRD85234.1 putative fatty acid desaturase protein [Aspergillus flavus]